MPVFPQTRPTLLIVIVRMRLLNALTLHSNAATVVTPVRQLLIVTQAKFANAALLLRRPLIAMIFMAVYITPEIHNLAPALPMLAGRLAIMAARLAAPMETGAHAAAEAPLPTPPAMAIPAPLRQTLVARQTQGQ